MHKCTCGRSTNQPWCDGSHTLTEDQYQARLEEDLDIEVNDDKV